MNLCEFYNISVGIPSNLEGSILFTDDSKTLKGVLAKIFIPFINTRKQYTNKCTLINIFEIGHKLKNGSYSGALGAFEKKEIDIFFRAEIPFTDSDDVYFSYPLHTEQFFIVQRISVKKLDEFETKKQLIKSFDLQFIFYYFLAFSFFTLAFLLYFIKSELISINKFKLITNFSNNLNILRNKNLQFISFFLFGLLWFDFFIKQIMTNNIKTSKVIVDTNQLITTEEKLFKSPLKAAWLEGESDFLIAKNAPKNTFLNKLYTLKNEIPIKIIEKKFSSKTLENTDKYFFLLRSYILKLSINMIGSFQENDVFYNDKPFFEVFTVFYLRKKIHRKKLTFLYKLSQILSQNGCYSNTLKQVSNIKLFQELYHIKIYTNLNSYIKDFTKFDSLRYDSFHYIFMFIICLYNFLLVAFFIF